MNFKALVNVFKDVKNVPRVLKKFLELLNELKAEEKSSGFALG